MIDVREYESLARETGAYRDIELEILTEALLAWQKFPGKPHILLDLRDGKILAGFAIMSKGQNTDSAFDIRDFCIDRAYIGKGVGEKLVEMLEEEVKRLEGSALIRIEISRKKEDSLGRGLFLSTGFTLVGHIPSFYGEDDDYFMYLKYVSIHKKAEDAAPKGATPQGAGPGAAPGGAAAGGPAESATSQGGPAESATSQGGPSESATSQGGPSESATSQGGPSESATSQGGPSESATSRGGRSASITSQGGPAASITSPSGPEAAEPRP